MSWRARNRLLMQIERSSSPLTSRMGREVRSKAKEGLRTGRVQLDFEKFKEPVVSAMVYSYLVSIKNLRQRRWYKRNNLNLSFESDVRRLAGDLNLNLDNVREHFFRFANRRLALSAEYLEGRINEALAKVTAEQLSSRSAIAAFNRELANIGVGATRLSYVETVTRTHQAIAFNAAQYQADNESDLVTGFRYVTVGDNRVRPEHARLDGLTRPKNDPIWAHIWPPLGWNCRCSILTLIDDEEWTDVPENWQDEIAPGFDFNPGLLLS